MALLFTWLFIKEKLLLFCQFSIILFFQWESYPHINYTISNRNTNKIFYYSIFFYFFLKKVEMFFDPDAALARALSFAVMEGLAACNTIHSTSYN